MRVAIIVTAVVLLSWMSISNSSAMATCEKTFSTDTCFVALNR